MKDENLEIIDFDEEKDNSNVILDNSAAQPEIFQGLGENNVENSINALNQTENILNESIKNNLGNQTDLQNIAASIQEDKRELDSGVLETEKWFRQSQEKSENKTTFNAAINPTINNISNSINFERPTEVQEEVKEEVIDNTDKNKKGIAFIVILFIILFGFVFALPYITNMK